MRVARHVVGWLARLRESPEPVVEDVRLLASEACTNSVLAHGEAGTDDPILVRATEGAGKLTVEVLDRASEVPEAAVEFQVDTGEMAFDRGTFLAVVQGIADEYEVEAREHGGSVVRATIYSQSL